MYALVFGESVLNDAVAIVLSGYVEQVSLVAERTFLTGLFGLLVCPQGHPELRQTLFEHRRIRADRLLSGARRFLQHFHAVTDDWRPDGLPDRIDILFQ